MIHNEKGRRNQADAEVHAVKVRVNSLKDALPRYKNASIHSHMLRSLADA